jgi:hypothetical protein
MNCCGGNLDLCIAQGATYTKIFTWFAGSCCGAVGARPAPVDLTGYTAYMQIRAYPLSTTVLYDASADLTLGGVDGTITLIIPADDTEDFTWWAGVYDLLLEDSSGNVTRLLSGSVTVCPGITMPSMGGTAIATDAGVLLQTDAGVQINTSN